MPYPYALLAFSLLCSSYHLKESAVETGKEIRSDFFELLFLTMILCRCSVRLRLLPSPLLGRCLRSRWSNRTGKEKGFSLPPFPRRKTVSCMYVRFSSTIVLLPQHPSGLCEPTAEEEVGTEGGFPQAGTVSKLRKGDGLGFARIVSQFQV